MRVVLIFVLGLACKHDAPVGRPHPDAAMDTSSALEDSAETSTREVAQEASDTSAEVEADRPSYPLNPACAQPALAVTRTVLSETFEGRSLDQLPGDPWVEANAGRTAMVIDHWTHLGQRALVVQSFLPPGQPEILYALLGVARTPARLSLTLYLAPNGFVSYRQFASVGFGAVASKFALDRHIAIRATEHALTFQGSVGGSPEMVFNEIPFATSAFRDTPAALYTYVHADMDFCTGRALVYVGADDQAPLRATLSFDPAVPINSFWIMGGANDTVMDDIAVEASGVLD